MAGVQIPITSELVTWARERAGYSLQEAESKFKKIIDWENPASDVFPTYAQLEELADTFKVPVAVFFFPKPPAVPKIEETFRTIPEQEMARIEPRMKLLLRKAKVLQLNLIDLNFGRNPSKRLITDDLKFPVTVDANRMAKAVRDYLGVDIEVQCLWPNAETALERWRSALSENGVFVFKDQFRSPKYAGFCLTHETFPLIYVNNTAPKTRQIFTLFHELAHLLFHTSGVDYRRDRDAPLTEGDAKRIEVLCNRFAGSFLVPEADFQSAIRGLPSNEETARQLARRFNVSALVIFRKMLDAGLVDQATYTLAHNKAAEERDGGGGGSFYNNQMAYLGRAYVGMVLTAYHQDRISETAAADYLLVNPKNVAGIEQRFMRGSTS